MNRHLMISSVLLYVVAGIQISYGASVDGFALLFAPAGKKGHVLKSAYFSPWQGGRGGNEKLFGGHPQLLAGIHGRSGDVLEALGVVVQRSPQR